MNGKANKNKGRDKMEGLYLYSIREKTDDAQFISIKGIDGKGEAYTLPFRGLEAIVSNVSLEEFASEEIQRKAQENLNWIKEKAIIHERVVEESMKKNGKILNLIPMKFGTIFKDNRGLQETLNKDYLKIKEVLERIRGKQEWSVKVYLRSRKRLEQIIKEKNPEIREKERGIAFLPEGRAFFVEDELKELISDEVEKELENMAEYVFESLKRQAVASVKCKILGKELTARREPMVLNAAHLIPEHNIQNFKKKALELNRRTEAKGFFLEYSGPWPAYNFTSLQHWLPLKE